MSVFEDNYIFKVFNDIYLPNQLYDWDTETFTSLYTSQFYVFLLKSCFLLKLLKPQDGSAKVDCLGFMAYQPL